MLGFSATPGMEASVNRATPTDKRKTIMEPAAVILLIIALVIGLFLYFLPTCIAVARGHNNTTAITVLNLLAGWTFVGWIVAVVWAFTADTK